ncbi:proline-rich protein 36-like [Hirundo rustica]|uniref:proline-rich protein 36-like n=1 Tax=Hirundo rustica TaxID=43150 RepID=UPI001A944AE0|nr:proline-rich protein 36-like [Hirundo rustica]
MEPRLFRRNAERFRDSRAAPGAFPGRFWVSRAAVGAVPERFWVSRTALGAVPERFWVSRAAVGAFPGRFWVSRAAVGAFPGRFWVSRAALGAVPEQRRSPAQPDADPPLTGSDATPAAPPSSPPIRLRRRHRSRPLRSFPPIPGTNRASAAPTNGSPPIRAFPNPRRLPPPDRLPSIFPGFSHFSQFPRIFPQTPLSPYAQPTRNAAPATRPRTVEAALPPAPRTDAKSLENRRFQNSFLIYFAPGNFQGSSGAPVRERRIPSELISGLLQLRLCPPSSVPVQLRQQLPLCHLELPHLGDGGHPLAPSRLVEPRPPVTCVLLTCEMWARCLRAMATGLLKKAFSSGRICWAWGRQKDGKKPSHRMWPQVVMAKRAPSWRKQREQWNQSMAGLG